MARGAAKAMHHLNDIGEGPCKTGSSAGIFKDMAPVADDTASQDTNIASHGNGRKHS